MVVNAPLDPEMKRVLQARLREFYEERMSEGQSAYFILREGTLCPTPMGRHWLMEHRRVFAELLALRPTDHFLDVACGEGYYTMPLARQTEMSIGVDVSWSALSLMRTLREYDAARLCVGASDVEALPFANEIFDKSLCSHLLEHVLDDRAVVREIHRVVKPGGESVFAIPLKYTWQYRSVRAAESVARTLLRPGKKPALVAPPGALDVQLVGRQAHIRHYSVRVFCGMLEEIGFVVKDVRGMWFHDPRNWFVRWTQPNRFFYSLGTRISKWFPNFGAGLIVKTLRS